MCTYGSSAFQTHKHTVRRAHIVRAPPPSVPLWSGDLIKVDFTDLSVIYAMRFNSLSRILSPTSQGKSAFLTRPPSPLVLRKMNTYAKLGQHVCLNRPLVRNVHWNQYRHPPSPVVLVCSIQMLWELIPTSCFQPEQRVDLKSCCTDTTFSIPSSVAIMVPLDPLKPKSICAPYNLPKGKAVIKESTLQSTWNVWWIRKHWRFQTYGRFGHFSGVYTYQPFLPYEETQ